jgi:uncharacterized protein YjbJ (UPF0337 family)
MDWQDVATHWARVIPGLKEKWGKLSDEDLALPEEKRELLASALERHYGIQRKHAELQLDRFIEKLAAPGAKPVPKTPPTAGKGT